MKPSLILRGVSFVVVLLHLSLFAPAASAQSKSCATPPDYKGPFSSAFSQNPELQDCSTDPICDPGNPSQAYNQVAQDWLDHAQIECITDAEQAYKVYGNKSFIQRLKDKDLTGKSTGSLNWITNTALSPELQQSSFEDLSPRSRAISNDKDRFDPAIFNGYCLYKGYNSIDECYQAIGELIPTSSGNPFPNLMALGNRLDKLLPTHELLKLERETCNDIILPCYAGNAPESVLCSHVYYLNDTASVSQVCTDLNEISDADYLKLGLQDRMKYLAVTFVTTLRPAFMVIAPNVELTRLAPGVYTQDGKFTHSNIPTLVRPFFIPGVSGALNQGALQELKMTLTLNQGNTTLSEIKKSTFQAYGPTQNTCSLIKDRPQADSTPYQCVINKINQFQPCQSCASSPKEEAQFFVSAHPPVGGGATGIIGFFLNLVGRIDKPEEIDGTPLKHFSGWFVVPGDLTELDQAQDLHANAPAHIFQNLETVQNTLVKQSMPIPINNQGDGSVEVTLPQPTAVPGTTPKPGEDTSVGTSGQGSQSTASFFSGGNLILTLMKNFNLLLSLEDKDRFQNQCYQPELLAKTQGSLIGTALSAVSGLVGGQEFDQYCPNNPKLDPFFTGGTPPPDENSTCANPGAMPPLGPTSCSLTHSTINGVSIPPTMKAIFETAGTKYSVPPDLLAAIMFAEGGFEPRVANDSCYGEYTEENIVAASVCGGEFPNCRTCNTSTDAGGCTSAGPYQHLRCPWSDPNEYNECNFYDATMGMAAYLARMSTLGDDVHVTSGDKSTSCNGKRYNPVTLTLPSSCDKSAWSCERVYTAIRYETGYCHVLHQQQVLQVYGACQ